MIAFAKNNLRQPASLYFPKKDSAPAVPLTVLFVGIDAGPTSGDDGDVMTFLEAKYGAINVTYIQATVAVEADMVGKDLGIISSTPSSGNLRGKWDELDVPQLLWEEAIYKNSNGDHHLSSSSSKPTGTQINVVDDAHPIMVQAGLSNGVQTIFDSNSIMACCSGSIPAGTNPLAEQVGTATIKTLVACDAGGVDSDGGTFAGRRTNFPIEDNGFADLNAAGLALFEACLDWLAPPVPIYANEKSLLLDGVNEIIEGPPSSDIVGVSPTAITFSIWIKTTNNGARYIQSLKRTNATPSTLFSIRIPGSNQIGFLLWTGGTHITINFSATGIQDGNWHHVCATVDSVSGTEIFVDGVSVGTNATVLNQTVDTVHPYTVGGFEDGWGSLFFDGNLDEPAIFTGATKFSLAEAVELYNGGESDDLNNHSRSADLKSWYRNGDDSGDDATGTTGKLVDQVSSPALDGTPFNTEVGDIVLDVP